MLISRLFLKLSFVALFVTQALPVYAENVTADTVLRNLQQLEQRQQVLPVFPKQEERVVELPPLDPSKSVLINELIFEGNESISLESLNERFADSIGTKFDFARMKNLTDEVGEFYKEQGLWAKAILPQQTLENGRLVIRIFEGRLGNVFIETSLSEGESLRFPKSRIEEFVVNGQKVGKTFDILAFEEGVKNLNAVPGITATGVLKAGEEQGETDVVINAANAPLASGSVTFDGNGGRATGYNQMTTMVGLDSPMGLGEQLTAMLMKSRALTVKSFGGSYPILSDGTRLGINLTNVNVAISGSPPSLSSTSLISLTRPFKQAVDMNISGTASLTRKETPDEVTADVLALNGVFSWPGQLFGLDAVNSVNLTSTTGWQYDTESVNKDASVDGLYSKFGFNLKQMLTLNTTDQLSLTLMGQVAFNNLDAGEKFGIAGLAGVRGYPAGEVSGDHGYFFSAQYQRQFGASFQGRTYFDHGFVIKTQNPWNEDSSVGNYVQLSGVGVGGTYTHPSFSVTADLATRLGNNPVAQADTGLDSDGTKRNIRAWIGITIPF